MMSINLLQWLLPQAHLAIMSALSKLLMRQMSFKASEMFIKRLGQFFCVLDKFCPLWRVLDQLTSYHKIHWRIFKNHFTLIHFG